MRRRFARFSFRLALAALGFAGATAAQPVIGDLAVVTGGLSQPIGIANPSDGTPRLFIVQQGGAARVVRNGALQPTPYFTLGTGTQCAASEGGALTTIGFTGGGERGLLGLAFHPSFQQNGRVFASFTDANGDSVIARFTASNPAADVLSASDLQTCVAILRVDQDFTNHNGGNILFGPDGYLYFGLGDGGSGNDPCNRGQTLEPAALVGAASGGNGDDCPADTSFLNVGGNPNSRALLGKMVRIDIDATTPAGANGLCAANGDGSANYAIPPGNPFVGANPACDETYSYGLRNPWRWSFDRSNGDLFLGDVGQDRWEEVSRSSLATLGGRNFDWRTCEARHLRGSCTNLCDSVAASEVIVEYENTPGNGDPGCSSGTRFGCSVTGGYRYRGPDLRFQGFYFYGDACRSELRWSEEDGGGTWSTSTDARTLTGLAGSILGFGEDDAGAVYFVAGGNLYRIGAAGATDLVFANSFE